MSDGPVAAELSGMEAARFTHRGTYAFGIAAVLLFGWMIAAGVILIISPMGDVGWGLFFLFIVSPFIGAVTINAFLGQSDVLIDDEGISRAVFGKVWQRIAWQKVIRIRLMPMPTFAISQGGSATVFYVDQTERPKSYFLREGGLFFNEQVDDVPKLINALNHYLLLYKIPIYSGPKGQQLWLDHIQLTDCVAYGKQNKN